jgi:hypothetical protein
MTAVSVTPRLMAMLDLTWMGFRASHGDVPEVVIRIVSGSAGPLRLGHFADIRWQRGPDDPLPEVCLTGDVLAGGPGEVLATLLHQAAHGMAAARRVQDTSRQGRWHNGRYRAIAAELGLDAAHATGIGWGDTTVPPATAVQYTGHLRYLATELTAWQRPEQDDGDRADSSDGAARCPCGRRIRVAGSVLDAGPITCGLCHGEFAAQPLASRPPVP